MSDKNTQVVEVLDVGHGDSSVIFLNHQDEICNTVIIDIPQSDKVLKALRNKNIKVVDLLIISHSDADHCKGVNDFLEKYLSEGRVLKICFNLDRNNPTGVMSKFLKKFMEYYKRNNIELVSGTSDTDVEAKKLIEIEDTNLSLIYPNQKDATNAYLNKSVNDMSIVCTLCNADYSILFTGDLGVKGWEAIFERNPELKCDILKMPHHGAYYDDLKNVWGTRRILGQLKPKTAIISTGENARYNHPNTETIKALRDNGVEIYCTQYTSLCGDASEYKNACSGDISIIGKDKYYDIKTQTSNKNCLNTPACLQN